MQFKPWLGLSIVSLLASGCSVNDDPSTASRSNTPDSGTPNSETIDSGTPNSETADSGTPNDEADSGAQCKLEATAPASAPTIVGTYTDAYGGTQQVAATTWTSGTSVFHLSQVDNVQLFAIAQNDCANPCYGGVCYGGEWSRFDWTYDAAHALWYCQTAYEAPSAQQALQTPAADAQNLATGCSGFPWSKLTPTS